MINLCPPEVKSALVLGNVKDAVLRDAFERRFTPCTYASSLNSFSGPGNDACLFLDPLPHSSRAERALVSSKKAVSRSGYVVCSFLAGAPNYSGKGHNLVLSRSGFEVLLDIRRGERWLVLARAPVKGAGPWGRERLQRRLAAIKLNEAGEADFLSGDYLEALKKFARATESWNEEAVIYSNLAVALHALGDDESAWPRVRDALYLDPYSAAARDNAREIARALGKTHEAESLLRLFGNEQPDA